MVVIAKVVSKPPYIIIQEQTITLLVGNVSDYMPEYEPIGGVVIRCLTNGQPEYYLQTMKRAYL